MTESLRIITAGGDPFTMGRVIGAAVAEAVRDRVLGHQEFRAITALWRGTSYLGQLEAAARQAYPRFVRELEGMAEGAGVDFATLFLWNCRGDLHASKNTTASAAGALAEGCTTVMIPGDTATGASLTIAHNEDGAPEFSDCRFWLRASPDEGRSFESYLYPGMLPGHAFAVNDAGLVQTINNIRVHDLKSGVPRHVITRAVLDCANLDAAVAVLRRGDRASGFHHALAQMGDDRVLSVEAPASACQVRDIEGPCVHANHLIAPELGGLPQEITESSAFRQSQASALLTAGDCASPEDILFYRGEDEARSILMRPGAETDDYSYTLATCVFEVAAEKLRFSVHLGPENRNVLTGALGS
ncbi:MAG: C45 family autoproteolytic acyltransferase/hydrolase [Alphaproteobacteria bacterium]